jgi:hypothetical protein
MTTTQDFYQFNPSTQVMSDIDDSLVQAKKENKKLLLVLGAKWCHDSMGLAKKFSTNEMHAILNEHYQTLFIDVGYYEAGFDVVKRFGMPIYYGTPTVMIIDPISENMVNRESMSQWMSADSLSLEKYQRYFTEQANAAISNAPVDSNKLTIYYQQIALFSQQQAKRLRIAYQEIGRSLKRNADEKVPFTKADDKTWNIARKLRYNIQNDIIHLKKQATLAVQENRNITLHFPEYEKFSWE